jgi:hypothetical protein
MKRTRKLQHNEAIVEEIVRSYVSIAKSNIALVAKSPSRSDRLNLADTIKVGRKALQYLADCVVVASISIPHYKDSSTALSS